MQPNQRGRWKMIARKRAVAALRPRFPASTRSTRTRPPTRGQRWSEVATPWGSPTDLSPPLFPNSLNQFPRSQSSWVLLLLLLPSVLLQLQVPRLHRSILPPDPLPLPSTTSLLHLPCINRCTVTLLHHPTDLLPLLTVLLPLLIVPLPLTGLYLLPLPHTLLLTRPPIEPFPLPRLLTLLPILPPIDHHLHPLPLRGSLLPLLTIYLPLLTLLRTNCPLRRTMSTSLPPSPPWQFPWLVQCLCPCLLAPPCP